MVATARQKRLYLHHQGEFQHNYFDFVSLHHSDHDGVVRIFVGHSEIVKRLLHYLHYITRHNFLYTRCVIYIYIYIYIYSVCEPTVLAYINSYLLFAMASKSHYHQRKTRELGDVISSGLRAR